MMRAVRSFVWVMVLVVATAVLLTFTGPLLPSPVNLANAEGQRTTYAAVALGVAIAGFAGLLVLAPLWRRELAGIRPARIGLATFGISLVVAAAASTGIGAILWGVVAPLPRRDQAGADVALAVTTLWFIVLSVGAGYALWSAVRRATLRPVLASPIGDGGLRAVTGIVRPHAGAMQLTDPVTGRPSGAWILDIEEEYWQEERSLKHDPFSNLDPKVVSTTTTSHKRKAGVAAATTSFLIDTPLGSVFCDDPGVRVVPAAKVAWEQGDPPLPPLPPEILEDLRRKGHLSARFGSRSVAPGDAVRGVGLIVIADDGVVELRTSPSVTRRFWLSPLHGIRAHVGMARRKEARALQRDGVAGR